MGKGMRFNTYLIEKFLKYPKRAEAYLKEALEEGDLELLQMSVKNLLEAGYKSFTITPKDSIDNVDIQLESQILEVEI